MSKLKKRVKRLEERLAQMGTPPPGGTITFQPNFDAPPGQLGKFVEEKVNQVLRQCYPGSTAR